MLQVFFNNDVVKQVDLSTLNGSVGILPKHVPLLGMLKPGVIRVVDKDGKLFCIRMQLFVLPLLLLAFILYIVCSSNLIRLLIIQIKVSTFLPHLVLFR